MGGSLVCNLLSPPPAQFVEFKLRSKSENCQDSTAQFVEYKVVAQSVMCPIIPAASQDTLSARAEGLQGSSMRTTQYSAKLEGLM